jgi:hypothetical protein
VAHPGAPRKDLAAESFKPQEKEQIPEKKQVLRFDQDDNL